MKKNGLIVIGLTGGIGSGKSTASSYLLARGHAVVDADKIAREIVEPGSSALDKLVCCFGQNILNGDGSLDRKKLAGIVFKDPALKGRLDRIMHGEILKLMKNRIDDLAKSGYNGIVFLDIPLLIEAGEGFIGEMDSIWVLDAADSVRASRVAKRDGVSRQHAFDIMKNQASREERLLQADETIDNSGKEEELYRMLDELLKRHEQK